MHVLACYLQDTRVFFLHGVQPGYCSELISVYIKLHVYFINCFNAERHSSGSANCVFTASAVLMGPICCIDTFFNFRLSEIQQIMCQVVAYGRSKTIENLKKCSLKVVAYKRWSLRRGGCVQEVPSIVIQLETFLYFGKVVVYERWSLTRGGHKGRFDCTNCVNSSLVAIVIMGLSSAYEVKNNCCIFERVFRVKTNGTFFFGISFFVLEIS